MARKNLHLNQYTKEYNQEPLRTYKEIIALAQKGIFHFILREVGKGRTYKEIGNEWGMTRANVNRIVQEEKKKRAKKSH